MTQITDSLLDATLDDLADLPSFKAFPPGVHLCKMFLAIKEINKKPAVEAKLVHKETLELTNPTDIPPNAGDETTVLYILKNNDGSANEIAQGQLKGILSKLKAAGVEGGSTREVIEAVNGIEIAAVTAQRENKQTGDKNTTLKSFELA